MSPRRVVAAALLGIVLLTFTGPALAGPGPAETTTTTTETPTDTDGDGLADGAEVEAGTDPVSSETDGDGVRDGDEADVETDPLSSETAPPPTVETVETEFGGVFDTGSAALLVTFLVGVVVGGGAIVLIRR